MMKAQIYCDPSRVYVICVDSYDEKILRGRIYNVIQGTSVPFTGAIDMILKLEAFLDSAKIVQSYSAKRAFAPGRSVEMSNAVQGGIPDGKLATFTLKLLFRQNTSWQGSVMWHEERSEETFRSVLELLMLMDNALSM